MAVAQHWMNGNDRGMDSDLYKDFSEMFSLMETFMEQRRSHPAPLIVTPAPVRQKPDRRNGQKVEALSAPVKGENRLRRPKSESSDENHTPLHKLNHYMSWNGCEDPELLQKKTFENLLAEVSDDSSEGYGTGAKQQYSDAFVQELLEENTRLRAMLKNGPLDVNETLSNMAAAEELGVLRSQVAALTRMVDSFQGTEGSRDEEDLFSLRIDSASLDESWLCSSDDSKDSRSHFIERVDRARRQYLAAVIAAGVCKEESLLDLVWEFRSQLELLTVQVERYPKLRFMFNEEENWQLDLTSGRIPLRLTDK
ncbi:hypothetical protein R1sor_027526 [Riccia sorocarpa]|uniref:Uncharacterized protein n=1 Tax=Riccia sorocarpa TaxID=122646 RepID=A0ABD3GEG1_9MARC